ncbi:MAG: sugar phosphate isomerase/epimerase, partial [bacterium]|nr:sugar phosphate isomerase/epimerase [bacterium]
MLKSLLSCTGANESPSRREMLRVASCAAAALLSPVGVSFADDESSRKDGEASGRCTLGFSTYGMQSLTTERAIDVLADIGYDAMELTVRAGSEADSAKLNAKRRQTLRKQLAESPLQLTSLMEHVYPTDDRQQKIALERLKLAAGVSHELSPEAP